MSKLGEEKEGVFSKETFERETLAKVLILEIVLPTILYMISLKFPPTPTSPFTHP